MICAGTPPAKDIGRCVFDDNGSGGNNRIVPMVPDPSVFADGDGGRDGVASFFRVQVVVEGGKNPIMPDEGSVTDASTALILKAASGIDENIFAKVRVKMRQHSKAFAHGPACQPSH